MFLPHPCSRAIRSMSTRNKWTPARTALLKRAATYPEVERIFVHPGIKKKLCDSVQGDRSWMAKIRPYWGHFYHFHVRIKCQPGSPNCKPQQPTGTDDGCGKSLAWWFTDEPWKKAPRTRQAGQAQGHDAVRSAEAVRADSECAGTEICR